MSDKILRILFKIYLTLFGLGYFLCLLPLLIYLNRFSYFFKEFFTLIKESDDLFDDIKNELNNEKNEGSDE
jgi:hypothetical protein